MSKFTKGPWVADLGEVYRVRSKQDKSQVAIMTSLTGKHGLSGRRDVKEVAANAHLIAAAPDLYEALELADAMLSGSNMNANAVENKVKAALSKALGEHHEQLATD